MIDRLRKILVGAGIKAGNHVLRIGSGRQNDVRRERAIAFALEAETNLDAVELRYRDVQEDQVGSAFADGRQTCFAIGRLGRLVAVRTQSRHNDVAIFLAIVDDEDARGIIHLKAVAPGRWGGSPTSSHPTLSMQGRIVRGAPPTLTPYARIKPIR